MNPYDRSLRVGWWPSIRGFVWERAGTSYRKVQNVLTNSTVKRLRRYGEYIFTFLDYTYIPHDNNFGERQIRPAVILWKNSQSNRSDRGAANQAVLMSVYRTLKLRGLNPTKTIADVLRTYLTTGQLPPLPD